MKLLEYQAKGLFARHGIAVPKGAPWPDLPEDVGGYVVKAQIPAGGRGKGGGIQFAEIAAEAGAAAKALSGTTVGDHVVEKVYIEERLDIARELYLSIIVDRDRGCRTIVASPDGGVEIESVPADRILKLPVDPLLGITSYNVSRVVRFLAVPAESGKALAATVRALHDLAIGEDAELVEINPLAVTAAGAVVAADAKVVLDGRARYRHADWEKLEAPAEGTEFERAVAAAGGVAAEMDPEGDVVLVTSGAGLMMASLDALIAMGARMRCVVDMAGTPFGEALGLVGVFQAVATLKPKATLISAYFHTALADNVARSMANAYAKAPLGGHLILRLVGRNAEEGREILEPLGFKTHGDMAESLKAVIAASRDTGEGGR